MLRQTDRGVGCLRGNTIGSMPCPCASVGVLRCFTIKVRRLILRRFDRRLRLLSPTLTHETVQNRFGGGQVTAGKPVNGRAVIVNRLDISERYYL